jgi:S1-C subfamily serine protease
MMNKLIIALLIVALALNGVLAYFSCVQKGNIESLSGQLAAARRELAALRSTSASLNSGFDTLNVGLASLKEESASHYAKVETGIKKNLENIDAGGKRITDLGNNLSALSGQVSSIKPGLTADNIYADVVKAVVQISDGKNIVGSGFIYDHENHVVTAQHVIRGITEIYVIFYDGMVSPASIINSSRYHDVALLELERPTTIGPLLMSDSKNVSVGDDVLVIGHPFGETNSLTVGVVSQVNRLENIGRERQEAQWVCNLIQFDAPVNPGNSGGPLFNANGKVIGMVVARVNPYLGKGMGLAVASNKLVRAVSTIIQHGQSNGVMTVHPQIGIFAVNINPSRAVASDREMVSGVWVTGVTNPAEQAGIRAGDIIVSIKDIPVSNTCDFASTIDEHVKPGDSVVLDVIRDGKTLKFEVKTIVIGVERGSDHGWQIPIF